MLKLAATTWTSTKAGMMAMTSRMPRRSERAREKMFVGSSSKGTKSQARA